MDRCHLIQRLAYNPDKKDLDSIGWDIELYYWEQEPDYHGGHWFQNLRIATPNKEIMPNILRHFNKQGSSEILYHMALWRGIILYTDMKPIKMSEWDDRVEIGFLAAEVKDLSAIEIAKLKVAIDWQT